MLAKSEYKAMKRIEKAMRNGNNELDLGGLELTTLPAEVYNLEALTTLNLNSNKLTTLPKEICRLTQLSKLNIAANELMAIPKEISHLAKLEHLLLHENNLTTLPAEIANLTQLKLLSLNNNKLVELPPEIINLNIEFIWKVFYIWHSNGIFIKNNPLKFPPAEIMKQGKAAVQLYFNEQEILSESLQEELQKRSLQPRLNIWISDSNKEIENVKILIMTGNIEIIDTDYVRRWKQENKVENLVIVSDRPLQLPFPEWETIYNVYPMPEYQYDYDILEDIAYLTDGKVISNLFVRKHLSFKSLNLNDTTENLERGKLSLIPQKAVVYIDDLGKAEKVRLTPNRVKFEMCHGSVTNINERIELIKINPTLLENDVQFRLLRLQQLKPDGKFEKSLLQTKNDIRINKNNFNIVLSQGMCDKRFSNSQTPYSFTGNGKAILVEKLSSINEIFPLLSEKIEDDVALCIFTIQIDLEPLSFLILNKLRGLLTCCVIRCEKDDLSMLSKHLCCSILKQQEIQHFSYFKDLPEVKIKATLFETGVTITRPSSINHIYKKEAKDKLLCDYCQSEDEIKLYIRYLTIEDRPQGAIFRKHDFHRFELKICEKCIQKERKGPMGCFASGVILFLLANLFALFFTDFPPNIIYLLSAGAILTLLRLIFYYRDINETIELCFKKMVKKKYLWNDATTFPLVISEEEYKQMS